jgi:hypothetical protein
MRRTLTVSASAASDMRESLFTPDGCENAGALLCGVAAGADKTRWLARHWVSVPHGLYQERLEYHLEIAPVFYNDLVDRAVASGLTPVIVHSHPGASAAHYSQSDDAGDARLLPVLAQLLPARVPVSALVTPDQWRARLLGPKGFIHLDIVSTLGSRVVRFARTNGDHPRRGRSARVQAAVDFDRQIRAVGENGQQTIADLTVAIVGLGGTGSAVAEQLARLGVRDLLLVDPDVLESSNVPRVWGSRPRDVGTSKVVVAARHLRRVAPSIRLIPIVESAIRQSVLERLRHCDIVFSCTDTHWSRAVLNRFAHQYLVPLVDLGVRLDARSGSVTAAAGRVSLVGSGLRCLRCDRVIDPERVRAESMPREERAALAKEGYVQGVEDPEPAVISLNTTVAGMAVTAGLSLFVNLAGAPPPTGVRFDARTGESFETSARHVPGCDVCDSETGVIGLGDLQAVSAYA